MRAEKPKTFASVYNFWPLLRMFLEFWGTALPFPAPEGLFPKHSCYRALVFALLDALALVVFLLASGYGYHELCKPAVIDEKPERHDGESCLFAVAVEAGYLLAVEQQFAVTASGVVVVCAVEVFLYIHVFHPHLAVVDVAERVGKACLTQAYRLYFGTGEHYAGCESLDDFIVECGSAVFYIYFFEIHKFMFRE